MKKLGIDSSQIKGHHLEEYSVKALEQEKKNVKGFLKQYDNEFFKIFQRVPEKTEKLPLKDLYMYYKHLKNRIDAKQRQISASQNSGARAQSAESGYSMRYSQTSGTTTPPTIESDSAADEGKNLKDDISPEKLVSEDRRSAVVKYGVRNKIMAQKKIMDLRAERQQLRTRLDIFQKEFIASNQRKIKYTTDIKPVAHEFSVYKALKNDIAELEAATFDV